MTNVGVVFDLSERAEQETYALLDLDGDGTAEKLLLRSRMAQAVNEVDHSPLDQVYICGEYHARRDADGTESGKQHLRLHS